MAIVPDKQTFLRLWRAGKLGNRLRSWNTLAELIDSGYTGLVSLRGCRPDSKIVQTHKSVAEIVAIASHYRPEEYFLGESAPDERLLIQGEFVCSDGREGAATGYVLTYSHLRMPMRKALAQDARHTYSGAVATAILKHYMDGNSWEDFCCLREEYPNAAIEFGTYEHFLGHLPARNTIFWEVRDY